MASFNKIFLRGLLTILPIAITIYVIFSAIIILDNLLGSFLKWLLPEALYIPGLGFILILLLIFVFGLMLNNFVIGNVLSRIEERMREVPFIKAIYNPLRDLMNLFSKRDSHSMGSVVLVRIGDSGAKAMGLVTREKFTDLHLPAHSTQEMVAVYFPFSYGLGGYTILVPQTSIEKIDIPVEKAMSLAITGWVKADQNEKTTT